MNFYRSITVLFLMLVCTLLKAQNTPKLDNLMWYSFISVVSHKKWYFQTEIHERHLLEPIIQHQFIVRTALYRELGHNFSACLGTTYLAHNTFKNDILQGIFPHIEVEHREKVNKLAITHNYRLEMRFFDDSNTLNITAVPQQQFYYYNMRIRYKLQLSYPILNIDENRKVFFRIFDEIHLNAWSKLPNNGFNHNRLYAGLTINTTKNLNTNIGFMHWLQQSGNQVFTGRKIYWIGFTHRIAK